jgi:chromosome segregation ATPase
VPPENPSGASIRKLTETQDKHLDVTETLLDRVETLQSSLKGTHDAIGGNFREIEQRAVATYAKLERISADVRALTTATTQLGELLHESITRDNDMHSRLESRVDDLEVSIGGLAAELSRLTGATNGAIRP